LTVQVIVVVTHGWHVLCFDHNLQLLWDRSIKVRPLAPALNPKPLQSRVTWRRTGVRHP
jgi:hypothetical protein